MLKEINKNEGIISAIGLLFTVITFIFSNNKWLAIAILFSALVVSAIMYFYRNSENFNNVQKKSRILFIDDKECQIVTSLRRNNFDVRKVDDILSPATDADVQWANLIFVDYKDVGKKLFGKKEGLGLIKELKRIYENKKRYVIYSTIQDFEGLVEFPYIRKNASYDEYISRITTEVASL